ncbi:MAG TPA: FtsW/RodA/SpoVE family cell cycle protein [Anaerolineales bacterium]
MNQKIESRLLSLAAAFLGIYALALTLSPAVRAHSWAVEYRWDHFLAVALWLVVFGLAHLQARRWLPDHDPYLLPIAGLLSGWGLLTVWRLYPPFGLRQTVWLLVTLVVFVIGLRLPSDLGFLRRYKYIWLTGGLLLTGLTLFLGTNPYGADFPRRWIGCCGVYLQPSEPLKLLLVVYLAAYLADWFILPHLPGKSPGERNALALPLLPLLAPTLVMTGLVVVLLVVQRDLGTASIFLFLYAAIIYVATSRKSILAAGGVAVILAGIAGYRLYDVVRVRVDAWLNPWQDPSGRSFQIVQSLLAVANGGLFGRGPGMGSPGLVPIPHSDFIFASITEETGLIGAVGLLLLVALLAERGLRLALHASNPFQRYLAAGLTAYLAGQSILIVGGNLRLLPLTGVTLPFVSYGGSSLLTSFSALLILLHISSQPEVKPVPLPWPRPYLETNAFLLTGLGACALIAGWWTIYRSPELLLRTDNPRRAIEERFVHRGSILDRDSRPLNITTGQPGAFTRQTEYPDLSNVLGYTHPVYGQSGLEAALDPYLRGMEGNPGLDVWWNHLLYGQPPAGLDVRLTLDQDLQRAADQALGSHSGALVLLNAQSGEILAIASHPTFDSNRLEEDWPALVQDNRAPLLDRALQGLYAPGASLGPLLLAESNAQGGPPSLPQERTYSLDHILLQCAVNQPINTWGPAISSGCPGAAAALGTSLGSNKLLDLFKSLGLFRAPEIRLPTASLPAPQSFSDPGAAALGRDLRTSPLQMALAAAALSAGGKQPAPYLVAAMNSPKAGWVILSPSTDATQVLSPSAASMTANDLAVTGEIFWQSTAVAPNGPNQTVTWTLAGTLPVYPGAPLALAVVVEENNPDLAIQIGQNVLKAAIGP